MYLIFFSPLLFCWIYTSCKTIDKNLFSTLYQAFSTSMQIFSPICCPMYFPLSLIPYASLFILRKTQIEPCYSDIQSNLVPSSLSSKVIYQELQFWCLFLGFLLNCLIVCAIRRPETLNSSSYSVSVLMDACLFCPQMFPNNGDSIVSAGNLLYFIILTFTKSSL